MDLHAHSTASDGVLSPEKVVDAAVRAGLAAIALTDHDTVAGIERAREEGALTGIHVVAGVELSAADEARETHLLGLHLDDLALLDVRLAEFRDARIRRAKLIVDRLNQLGVPVSFESVLEHSGTGAIGRPHIARAMIAGGWVPDLRIAFDQYLGSGRPAFVPKEKLSVEAAIALIHAAGGVAIFAHPAAGGTLEIIRQMLGWGLDGIEVLHPSHGADDVARLNTIADHLGCLKSGGSDWHGVDAGRRTLGGQHVPHQWMVAQIDAAARVRESNRGMRGAS